MHWSDRRYFENILAVLIVLLAIVVVYLLPFTVLKKAGQYATTAHTSHALTELSRSNPR